MHTMLSAWSISRRQGPVSTVLLDIPDMAVEPPQNLAQEPAVQEQLQFVVSMNDHLGRQS